MPDGVGVAFDLLIAVTVLVTALAIGMDTTAAAIRRAVSRRSTLVVVLCANAVALPVAAFVVVNALPVEEGQATGIMLCAICAAGPLGLKASQIARADLAWALSIVVIMTILNFISVPVWTASLLPRSAAVQPADLLGAMLVLVVLPVVFGALVRQRHPARARGRVPSLESLSHVTLALAIAVGLVAHHEDLLATARSWTPVAAVVVLALAATAGSVASGPPAIRQVSTLVTVNRGTGIALLVVSRSFADQDGVFSTVIVFGIVQTIIVVGVALIWRRRVLTTELT